MELKYNTWNIQFRFSAKFRRQWRGFSAERLIVDGLSAAVWGVLSLFLIPGKGQAQFSNIPSKGSPDKDNKSHHNDEWTERGKGK